MAPAICADRFEGRVAVVTGAASGIGLATVHRLSAEGASVALVDLNGEDAGELASTLPSAIGIGADVADSAAVDAAFAQAASAFGRLDYLAHAAGIGTPVHVKQHVGEQILANPGGQWWESGINGVVDLSDEDWRRLITTNLDGTFYCTRAALRHMIPAGSGSIVTISSIAAITGEPGLSAYGASKGGVRIFTHAVAREVIGHGIRVNTVAPGPTNTGMISASRSAGIDVIHPNPIRRNAEPEEIAAAIAFLLSDDASFVVGETMIVSGGMVMA